MVISMLAVSTPTFFLALLLQLVFAVWLGVLPSGGMRAAEKSTALRKMCIRDRFIIGQGPGTCDADGMRRYYTTEGETNANN